MENTVYLLMTTGHPQQGLFHMEMETDSQDTQGKFDF